MNVKENETQDQKTCLLFSVKNTCSEIAAEYGVHFSDEFISTLNSFAFMQIKKYAKDLEVFAKHANRTTIDVSDVKLLVRHSKPLFDHICSMDTDEASNSGMKKINENPNAAIESDVSNVAVESDVSNAAIESDVSTAKNSLGIASDKTGEMCGKKHIIKVNVASGNMKEKAKRKTVNTAKNLDVSKATKIKESKTKLSTKRIAVGNAKSTSDKKKRNESATCKVKSSCVNQRSIKSYMLSENGKAKEENSCQSSDSNAAKDEMKEASSKGIFNVPIDSND